MPSCQSELDVLSSIILILQCQSLMWLGYQSEFSNDQCQEVKTGNLYHTACQLPFPFLFPFRCSSLIGNSPLFLPSAMMHNFSTIYSITCCVSRQVERCEQEQHENIVYLIENIQKPTKEQAGNILMTEGISVIYHTWRDIFSIFVSTSFISE